MYGGRGQRGVTSRARVRRRRGGACHVAYVARGEDAAREPEGVRVSREAEPGRDRRPRSRPRGTAFGKADDAHRTAIEAVETGRRRKTPVWEAQAHLALARVLLARFGHEAKDETASALGACPSLVEQTQARVYEPHVHEVRAALERLNGDAAAHERQLRHAHRLFTAMGATGHAERVAKALGS